MKFYLNMMLIAVFALGGCAKKEQVGQHKDQPPHNGTPVGAGDAPAGATPVASAPEVMDGYLKVGFDRLDSFPFVGDCATVSAAVSEAQIPSAIKKLNGQKVIVTGFMLPVKMSGNDELTTEFLLLRSQLLCCYGIAPQANEWVLVEMPKGVKPIMDVPISFRGTLHVGAMFENGYLTGIYSLDGE